MMIIDDGKVVFKLFLSHNALELQVGLSLIVYTTRTYLVSVT